MARHKTAKNAAISPWLSARVDNREGRFSQVGMSFYLSKAVQALSPGARWLYQCMTVEAGGRPTVTFTHGAGRKYGVASSSFDRHIKELRRAGFIELLESVGMGQFQANTYRFSLAWKSNPAPQNGEG